MKTFIFLLVPFLKRAPCFIHCEGQAAKGGEVLMSIMIPSCNVHAYMKFLKKNFAPHAKNATVKNIITINKYNVGMKSPDRANIFVSDTLKTETSPIFISQVRVPVPAPLPVLDSGFSIRPYNQLSSKRPLLVHGKVVTYRRCLSIGKPRKKAQTELIIVIK